MRLTCLYGWRCAPKGFFLNTGSVTSSSDTILVVRGTIAARQIRYLTRFTKFSFSSWFSSNPWMFGLSFLTTLNIYKDYFKGRKRLRTVAQEHNSISMKKSVIGNLVCPSSWRSCCVLYTIGFCDQETSWSSSSGWTEELCNQHTSQVGDQVTYWDSCNWLVTYWEPCIEKEKLSLQNKSNWVLG